MILLDCREGEPDRTGAAASFEGFFDFETGEPRRPGYGIPRLRIVRPAAAPSTPATTGPETPDATPPAQATGVPLPTPATGGPLPPRAAALRGEAAVERVWGFEVWWRPDPTRAGLTDADREDVEASKRLLRGLARDARRRTPLAAR